MEFVGKIIFLGALEKLRKTTISFVMSVRLYVFTSVCLSVPYVCPSVCLSVLYVCSSVCLSELYVCSSVCLSELYVWLCKAASMV